MTKKLYDIDSHIRSFDAQVIGCEKDETKNLYAVELDQTAFFAEGGGQACDRGVLRGLTVEDVQEKNERVLHYVAEPMTVGETVHGELDWAYRFDNMQQHSGEHILSGLMYAQKGYHNVGFHLGEDVTTLDFDGPLTADEVKRLEREGNEIVYRNLPFSISYPDAETLKQLDYRSKKELFGAIRIVKVGNPEDIIDCCACCAPHVMLSGEVGMIKIIRAENYKGGIRLTIVCGLRALKDYGEKHDCLSKMAGDMSTSIDHVPASVAKLKDELAEKGARVALLAAELNQIRAEQLKEKGKTQRSLVLVEKEGDQLSARNLINLLCPSFDGHVAVLLPKEEGTFFFIVGSEKEDLRQLAASMRKDWGCRGGGSEKMIQGTVSGEENALRDYLEKD